MKGRAGAIQNSKFVVQVCVCSEHLPGPGSQVGEAQLRSKVWGKGVWWGADIRAVVSSRAGVLPTSGWLGLDVTQTLLQ